MTFRGKSLSIAILSVLSTASIADAASRANVDCKAFCAQIREREAKNPACKMTVIRASSSICGCRFETPSGVEEEVGGVCSVFARTHGEDRVWRKVTPSWADASCGYWANQGIPKFCKEGEAPTASAPPVTMTAVSATVPAKTKPKPELSSWDKYRQCYYVLRFRDGEKGINLNEVGTPKWSPMIAMPQLASGPEEPAPGVYVSTGTAHLRLPPPKLEGCGGKTYYRMKNYEGDGSTVYETTDFTVDWQPKGGGAPRVSKKIPEKIKNSEQCLLEVSINKKDANGNPIEQDYLVPWDKRDIQNDEERFGRFLLQAAMSAGTKRTCAAAKFCENVIKGYKPFAEKNCPGNNAVEDLGGDEPAPAKPAGKAGAAK